MFEPGLLDERGNIPWSLLVLKELANEATSPVKESYWACRRLGNSFGTRPVRGQ